MHEHDVLCFGETMAMFVAEQTGDLASVGQFGKRIAGADSITRMKAALQKALEK